MGLADVTSDVSQITSIIFLRIGDWIVIGIEYKDDNLICDGF